MKPHKRKLFILTILLLALSLTAACSQQSKQANSDGAAAGQEQSATEQTATEQTAAGAFAFKDKNGKQTLKEQPQRIATTVTYLTDHMIALGMTPASTVKSQNEDFPEYLQPYLNHVEIIGEQGKVSMEKLLSLSSDLIITDTNSEDIYDQYAKIAPTAMLENGYMAPNWEEAFRWTAAAFDKSDEAEKIIQDYNEKKAQSIAGIHDKVAGKTLMVLRIRNDIRYYGDMDYKWLYDDFGFSRPAVFPETSADSRYEVLSNEKLPEINPDYILLINDNEELYNKLEGLGIWKNLNAVKNNQVYRVASDSWFGGYGPNAASSMLDDLNRIFNP